MMLRRVTELHTERLRMRRVLPDDLDAIHAIMSDPETMRFWSSPPHATREETEKWFASMVEADQAGESDEFVLEHLGVVIGKLGAWRHPEIGFFLRHNHWGLGLASEALRRFISYSKNQGSVCLTADVDPRNAACLRLLSRCGFRETGRQRGTYEVAGEERDSVFLKLDLNNSTTSSGGKAS